MRKIMESLLALQRLEFDVHTRNTAADAQKVKLREEVPAPILGHFDRLLARGKKGVAVARKGVCSECHLRISSGALASLACADDIHLCDNCGRYLYLPENEPLGLVDEPSPAKVPAKSPARRSRQKAELRAV